EIVRTVRRGPGWRSTVDILVDWSYPEGPRPIAGLGPDGAIVELYSQTMNGATHVEKKQVDFNTGELQFWDNTRQGERGPSVLILGPNFFIVAPTINSRPALGDNPVGNLFRRVRIGSLLSVFSLAKSWLYKPEGADEAWGRADPGAFVKKD